MAPTAQPPSPPPQRRRAGPPPGLKNLGNTCYLNSVLQCLASTPPLASFCLSSRHSNLCKKVFPSREKECAFCVLERQIARLLRLDVGALDSPGKIIRCLPLFAENFRWGRQEDAHEFLRYVIDACNTAGLRLCKRLPVANANGSCAEEEGQGPSTVMKEIFGGSLLSQVKCLACKGESNKTDEIMDICLDLPGSSSIGDALARFFQPEVLDGANMYSCGRCKKLTEARKQMFILKAPKVLVIQLKRFEGINGGKINRTIEFKEVLVLSDFMYNLNQDSQQEYNLFGSIVHSGFSPESGHYYAYIKDVSGRWYCCNDSQVSLASSQEVLSEKVYILFYILSTKTPKPCTNGYSCGVFKSSNTNGNGMPPSVISRDRPKASLVKQNGSGYTKGISPPLLKNGKIAPGPQFKQIHLKNIGTEKVPLNGKANLFSRNNAEINECATPLESDSRCKDGKSAEHSDRNANGSITFGKMDVNSHRILPDANGNGHTVHSKDAQETNDAKATCAEQYTEQSYSAVASASEKKICSFENSRKSVLHCKEPASSVKDVVVSSNDSACLKHHPGEEEFKDMLVKTAFSELRSCGWVNDVCNFMRSEKKRRIQDTDMPQDSDSMRKQLIIDSERTFRSKIPVSLREHLIGCLKSYYQDKISLDV